MISSDPFNQVFSEAVEAARISACGRLGSGWVEGRDHPYGKLIIPRQDVSSIRRSVIKAVEEGWPPQELMKRIMRYAGLSKDAAMIIARTELLQANNLGQMTSYRASEVVIATKWLTAGDDQVCGTCARNAAAGEVPLDHRYPSGDICPPAEPCCRCCVVPVVHPDYRVIGAPN